MSRLSVPSEGYYLGTPNLEFKESFIGKYTIYNTNLFTKEQTDIFEKFQKEILVHQVLQKLFQQSYSQRRKNLNFYRQILIAMLLQPNFNIKQKFFIDEAYYKRIIEAREGKSVRDIDKHYRAAVGHMKEFFAIVYSDISPQINFTRGADQLDSSYICNENCVFDLNLLGSYNIHNKSFKTPNVKSVYEKFNNDCLVNVEVLKLIFNLKYLNRLVNIRIWKKFLELISEVDDYDDNKSLDYYLDIQFVGKVFASTQLSDDESIVTAYNYFVQIFNIAYGSNIPVFSREDAMNYVLKIQDSEIAQVFAKNDQSIFESVGVEHDHYIKEFFAIANVYYISQQKDFIKKADQLNTKKAINDVLKLQDSEIAQVFAKNDRSIFESVGVEHDHYIKKFLEANLPTLFKK
ncbi:hypothetical protein KGF54_002375 [Candida jiufengensis]|uniref:uncharacterized protein n=1 Tax=Candida jiufengensis TaxID=497108 RepID=UPI002224254F|nr:uncharacterized protein KGF54_002375 [Candida jiufengensis]KAI5954600.1 hypothetical protein KGF54_002375 [Candida jiufengensis]